MTRVAQKSYFSLLFFVGAAFSAGLLNGLLGTGGGMVLLFCFGLLLQEEQQKEAFAISGIAVFCFCLTSMLFYGRGGSIDFTLLPQYALPALVGGIAGALLLRRIGTGLLRKIFALLLLYSGLKMTGVL